MDKSHRMVAFSTLLLVLILAFTTTQILAAPPVPERPHPDHPRDLERFHKDSSQPAFPAVQSPAAADWAASPWSKIAFESLRDSTSTILEWEVYQSDGYGSNPVRLTNNNYLDYDPRFNRGCTKIAFASDRDGQTDADIYSMNPDGSVVTKLTDNTYEDYYPLWSPDGTQIIFQTNRNSSQHEIYKMNSTGSSQARLTDNSAFDGYPAWSPDGTKIAFSSTRSGDYRVWVMNADGSNPVQLSSTPQSRYPVWSPDGTQIAYTADGNSDDWWELWVMNSDGSNQHLVKALTYGNDWGWDVRVRSWSPDGRYITFTALYWEYDYTDQAWYWWYAYQRAWDLQLSSEISLGGTDLDWNPDWQTCDNLPPTTAVNALPAFSLGSFLVSWGGSDQGLAGIKSYDIQVRDGTGGAWTNWLLATTGTSQTYIGTDGHTYYFRSRSRDNAYNLEAYPADYDAYTTVDTVTPTSAVNPLPPFVNAPFLVGWGGSDAGGSGIQSYDIQYRDGLGGTWTDWQLATAATSALFSGTSGHTYYFRSRARDGVNHLEDWPASYDAYTLLDSDLPASGVEPLPAYSPASITVSWDGSDTGGSGLLSYDIQYRDGPSGGWVDWQLNTAATSAPFTGVNGHTYAFRGRARDNAGNLEAWPVDPDTSTIVDTYAPVSSVSPLAGFSHPGLTVVWSGFDNDGGSGLLNYDVQYKDTGGGDWVDWMSGVTITSNPFNGDSGHTYQFRSRARDLAGNVELWPTGVGDTTTTLYTWKVSGEATDNAGKPIQGASASGLPPMFLSPGSDSAGGYAAYNAAVAVEYEVTFAKSGYGSLSPATLDGSADAIFNAVLPPMDNLIDDWGFESGAILPAWTAGGSILPDVITETEHTGDYAALLGEANVTTATQSGESSISQAVTLPISPTVSTLSFLLNLGGGPSQDYSWFKASLQEGITTTDLVTVTTSTEGWDHHWFDLSDWAGKTITLTFTTRQTDGQLAAWAYLDEVSLGSSHPDVWVSKTAWDRTVLVGELITYTLAYGNRGAAPAGQVVITDTLPAELALISASVTPDATTPALVWELGLLPAGSGPYSIDVTAQVVANPASGYMVTNEVTITTETTEYELLNNNDAAETMIGSQIFLPILGR